MAAFRRVVIALAVLAAFASLASAQMSCSPNSSNGNAYVRQEGKSELIGDLVLFCTGGTPTQAATAPQVNITVTLPQAVTSKQLGASVSGYVPTEALLVINDGNVIVAGAPPTTVVSQNFCATTPTVTAGTCPVFEQINSAGGFVPSGTAGQFSAAATALNNVYQGWVNTTSTPNQVTFFGVPVVPPGTNGQLTLRVVNMRENVSAGSTGQIVAQIGSVNTSGTGAQQITLTAVTQVLGNVQPSLKVTATPFTVANCSALNWAFAGTLAFTQQAGFSNAFKTRQLPNSTTPAAGSATASVPTPQQATATNAAGSTSESGYALNIGTGAAPVYAGLADYGTRLKAIFSNIPSGARVFVSFANVTGAFAPTGAPGAISSIYAANAAISGSVANVNSTALAELLLSGAETLPDSGGTPLLATPNALTATQALTGTAPGIGPLGTTFPFYELAVSGGAATAVWEVLNTASTASFTFDVFITLPAQGSTGSGMVNLSYAPTITTLTVPAFVDPNAGSPQTAITITQCRTILLFPYLTSYGGFDTGIAIANTSTDVLGTTAQNNTCSFTLYGDVSGGGTVPTIPAASWSVNGGTASATIASGHVGAFAISQYAPGFTGYGMAVCNFQFAHGFAFVADWGNPNYSSAMGYLALIVPPNAPRLAIPTEALAE
jgi:hypothetical protein